VKYETWLDLGDSPSPIEFYENMTRRKAREFAAGFARSAPSRVERLRRAVRSTPGLGEFELDGSPGSFERLGPWCRAAVPTRWHTPEEVEQRIVAYAEHCRVAGISCHDPHAAVGARLIHVDPQLSASILADVGTYIGEACRVLDAEKILWRRDPTQYKRDVDYNAVVLWRGGNKFNPIFRALSAFHRMVADNVGDNIFQGIHKRCRQLMALEPWPGS